VAVEDFLYLSERRAGHGVTVTPPRSTRNARSGERRVGVGRPGIGTLPLMCRSIHTLYNFEPPATEEEVRSAALQYVRKVSGFTKPSRANADAFERAVDAVATATEQLLGNLVTSSSPKDRELEAAKARARRAEQQAA
jgi:hypothetical protein